MAGEYPRLQWVMGTKCNVRGTRPRCITALGADIEWVRNAVTDIDKYILQLEPSLRITGSRSITLVVNGAATPAVSNMDTLPVEILHHIFLLTCSDGGRTGASLSLVSRSYRNIARPVRYNSVALISYTNIGTFLECYKTDRAILKTHQQDLAAAAPAVRHLFLTADASDIERVNRPGGSGVLQTILHDLFQLVGSNLVTLSYTCHAQLEALLADCAFPRLEELTFLRNVPLPYRFSAIIPIPAYPQLPHSSLSSLRKLHIILITVLDHAVPVILAHWAHAAPNVSHLRVSNLRGGMGGIEWLRDMIGRTDMSSSTDNRTPFADAL